MLAGSDLRVPHSHHLIPQLCVCVQLIEGHQQVLFERPVDQIPEDNSNLHFILKRIGIAPVILRDEPVKGLKSRDEVITKVCLLYTSPSPRDS